MFSERSNLLLNWYREQARDLPWRKTQDPYAIWISEIMLQQTQVNTVLPRYAAWFERFPDISTLASAPLDDVLKAWEGLGYYRRARLLHKAAEVIVVRYDGLFPDTFEDIRALPGIGRTTAGAISSVCFGSHTPVLDGNVKRVLRRWHGLSKAHDAELWLWAQSAIDIAPEASEWNQAMMELGATVCTPRSPVCNVCPAHAHCRSAFDVTEATSRSKPRIKDVYWRVSLHVDPGKGIWLIQRPQTGIWGGLWTPPISELSQQPDRLPCHIHQLTHRRLHLYGVMQSSTPIGEGRWVSDIARLALPTGIHRLLQKHGIHS